ncbi:MAG: hypothetical protein JW807_16660 [Spirochaetes bacterium]|nr:hypothetical protein [Spirochaetota bacterium]
MKPDNDILDMYDTEPSPEEPTAAQEPGEDRGEDVSRNQCDITSKIEEARSAIINDMAVLKARAQEAGFQEQKPEPKKGTKSRSEIAALRLRNDITLFTDGESGYATYKVNEHLESARITSKQFRKFIRYHCREQYGLTLTDHDLNQVIGEIDAGAVYDGMHCIPCGRIGKDQEGNILINTGWHDWTIIVICPGSWHFREIVTPVTPVTHFSLPLTLPVKPRGMLPLPHPEKGQGCLDDLRRFVGCSDDDQRFLLIVSFIIQAMFFDGPFPILVILAEPGSGKTVATVAIKRLIDPHEAATMSVPREPRDMFAAAGVSWLMPYDNFSNVPQWLSDLFCRFSTGNATIDRELFTNGEAYIYSAKRPTVVNGISDFFSQSDVLQRSLVLNFDRIKPENRKHEAELWEHYEKVLPGIFHDLLDLAAHVLEVLPSVTVNDPSRMADFCRIGTAVATVLPDYDASDFMTAYTENQNAANDITLESSVVYPALREMLSIFPYCFTGTPNELLTKLKEIAPEAAKSKLFPKTPAVLSGTMKRLAPNLRTAGYNVESWRDHDGRHIDISKSMQKSDTSDTNVTETDTENDFLNKIPF